jgi:hypothetical protein
VALTRKRKREIAKLKGRASDLWDDQKDVLDRANKVVREASRHAGYYAKSEVAPRVQEAFEDKIAPALATGVATGATAVRSAASAGRSAASDVLPAASSALGSALALLDVAKDQNVRDALKQLSESGNKVAGKASDVAGKASKVASKASKSASQASKSATKAAAKAGLVKQKSSGPGRYILIGIGIVAAIGVAYAAWQTLRADDDLWIDDEDVTEPAGDSLPS